jgi:hypothetical protein
VHKGSAKNRLGKGEVSEIMGRGAVGLRMESCSLDRRDSKERGKTVLN